LRMQDLKMQPKMIDTSKLRKAKKYGLGQRTLTRE